MKTPGAGQFGTGKRRIAAGVVAVAAVVALAGCGSSSSKSTSTTTPTASKTTSAPSKSTSTPSKSTSAMTVTITINNFKFSPDSLTVKPGTRVAVHNIDTTTHTLTATSPHTGAFNTGDVSPNTTKYFTAPSTPGTYPYDCTIHQFMTGTLTVS